MNQPKIEFTQDAGGGWRWKLLDEQGDTVAICSGGYTTRDGAEGAFRDITRIVNAGVVWSYPAADDLDDEEVEPERPKPLEGGDPA